MAINYPGPYDLRIKYTIAGLVGPTIQHESKLNVSIFGSPAAGLTFPEMSFVDANGVNTITLDTLTEDWLTIFNTMFTNAMSIDAVELWKYPTPQSFDAQFWATYTPTANAGTGAGTAQPAGQNLFVFRSREGGIMKLSAMETNQPAGVPLSYAGLTGALQAVVDFILDGDQTNYSAPFLARDTSYPLAFTRMFPGQNEALFKKRYGR